IIHHDRRLYKRRSFANSFTVPSPIQVPHERVVMFISVLSGLSGKFPILWTITPEQFEIQQIKGKR
ncbi:MULTISPECIES: hypothetical protein, partial [Enterobacteriaceae]